MHEDRSEAVPDAPLTGVTPAEPAAAVATLQAALGTGTDEQVAAAARWVRKLGTAGVEVPWHAIYDIETRVRAREQLREQLRLGDTAGIARAWSRCVALPGMRLDADEDAPGRAAFRHWGHALRLARSGASGDRQSGG